MTDILPQDEIAADSIAERSLLATEHDLGAPNRPPTRRIKGFFRNLLISIPLIALVIWTVSPPILKK